eukprot:CAMPEP_0113721348 /NCGR_PEP_ID=MMETSP0038_2-20120614/37082_1 /TAXON_ID=2898 /ORGANISM="Cryptomonas paramecium" /LENGTH=35 /DNA_ID=CAMNT_0000650345 /DNA_START=76 /DNA_END=180 /DNA_ORIENTATION=- /assembly_acc=CAM_ASM_000170
MTARQGDDPVVVDDLTQRKPWVGVAPPPRGVVSLA